MLLAQIVLLQMLPEVRVLLRRMRGVRVLRRGLLRQLRVLQRLRLLASVYCGSQSPKRTSGITTWRVKCSFDW